MPKPKRLAVPVPRRCAFDPYGYAAASAREHLPSALPVASPCVTVSDAHHRRPWLPARVFSIASLLLYDDASIMRNSVACGPGHCTFHVSALQRRIANREGMDS